ncbi:IPT/TIG domain-containing protein [Hymenobacter lapidarius]|uniref:IPT/TIG domain-containing protein n=1 Tax=Hymenobacter lapidarius TaxID=1908237 RepID=UPI001EFC0D6B|nr:IPT/TIG domain-containing protein [Hymenobacter lapidarius]
MTPSAQVAGGPDVVLTITGTGFTPTTTVNFNGVNYTQTSSTATSLVVTIPASALATAGSFPVTVTNTAGTSSAFTFTVSNPSTAGAFENFETGTKGSYAAGEVTLNSGVWNFSEALLGTSFADRFNGLKSARIRGGGFIAMSFDKPTGAGVVTINAALYGTDAPASFLLEISTNGGTSYTAVSGAPAVLTTTLTPYTFTVNQAGNVRLRISSTNTVAGFNPRISIDDISITNFTAPVLVPTITSFTPSTGGPGTAVTITGTNFTGATAVKIGSFAVTNFTVVSATSITLVVPAGTGSVSGLLTVTTPGGTATSAATFNLVSATLASKALPGLSVFPNPATDRVTVALPKAGAATIAIRDLTGRLVLAPAALAANREVLLPAGLAAGVYLLEVQQNSVTAIRRIQKN